ncbi:ISAzo13 family transposase ISMco6 [subsurface metagenome]
MYDFPKDALGRAVPYGIYDMNRNCGQVYVGNSADTPEFAVDAISRWWLNEGSKSYAGKDRLLILADGGGINSCRFRGWREKLQQNLSDRYGLTVTVCHYPTGCSKWNPIEHRMFSHISINWSGKPLRTFDTMLSCICGTSTDTGLKVEASMLKGEYKIR